jgi:hypothetical protein
VAATVLGTAVFSFGFAFSKGHIHAAFFKNCSIASRMSFW